MNKENMIDDFMSCSSLFPCRYSSKPVIIEAIQYAGFMNLHKIAEFVGYDRFTYPSKPDDGFYIKDAEGNKRFVALFDFIVKDTDNKFHILSADTFCSLYHYLGPVKKPAEFSYFHYTNKDMYDDLIEFAGKDNITSFNNDKIAITNQSHYVSKSPRYIQLGDYVVRLKSGYVFNLPEEAFNTLYPYLD